ncbi:cell division protein FtsQ/DivIB [Limimaricola hongkongensis]|uniref:Cell division protein FtsQ n=1 Tax=Limimaricola hongkongensis DSM 17492 TaxID=1122180 RepID=A0A017HAQ2_9RHOB|nr:cell division protein FtsQ/DivIB [Limimaricola hongkongensis]EYD71233.1 Cell division protein FtsQ [Limimaricola hongkongensis DSM 17492]
MRSLKSLLRREPQYGMRRDPAPTRWGYRYQRLMLTPAFRIGMRFGLPVLGVALVGGIWFGQADNRAAFAAQLDRIKATIQQRPEFMVGAVEIDGAEPALAAAIKSFLPETMPISSFDLDLPEIRTRIRELTAVADATVRVQPGGTLEIAVTQRVPVAVWRYVDGLRLVDAKGVMTGMIGQRSDRADLPLIAGDGAREKIDEALALFAAAAPVADRVRGLVRMGERRWDLVLDRDQRILLPAANPVPALERVMALDGAEDMLARDIAAVDIRNEDRPTIRLTEQALVRLRRVSDNN